MNSTMTVSIQHNLLEIVKTLGEPDTVIPVAVRQYVVDRCLQRLDDAEAKVTRYAQKYDTDYETFHQQVTMDQDYLDRLNSKHPLWEMDAIEWAYRLEEVALWQARLTKALQGSSPWLAPA